MVNQFNTVPMLAALAAFAAVVWHFWRSHSLLHSWAAENGFEILRSRYRFLFRGPYFWISSKHQTVYYVTIRDGGGVIRSGWVCCGSWWLGLLSNQTDVRWDYEI